jgi:flavin reductase (DIM6/NTAB) family NADH-FMN oxidoreductase RutF
MLKVVGEDIGAFYQHYPRVAAIVTVNHSGRKNAMAVAWHSPVSFKPPLYGIAISPKRYTYSLVSESRQFGINFMPQGEEGTVAAVGGSSGSLTDKFTEFNIEEDSAIKTDVPILNGAYAAYECKVVDSRIFGDHAWIIGEIIAVHIAGDLFQENGIIDLNLLQPALYLGADTYCAADSNSLKVLDRNKYGKR